MKKILQIGPVPHRKHETVGGVLAYMEGFLAIGLPGEYRLALVNTNVRAIFKKIRLLRPLLSLGFVIKLLWQLIVFRPDIAHIHVSEGIKGSGIAEKRLLARICKLFGVIVVQHLHGAAFDDFYRERTDYFSSVLNEGDMNIVLSQAWKQLFANTVDASKLSVIPNAIATSDFRREAAENRESLRILFVGAVGGRKGLPDLGSALSQLSPALQQQIHLDIIGPEEFSGENKRIEEMFKDFGLHEICTFHGAVFGNAKNEFYSRADIFVLPSRNESFGIVNLEAMASSLPVISTAIGAIPEYLEHGKNGLLFEPGDTQQLAEHLETMILDRSLREKMGAANKEKVRQKFDWTSITQQVADIYRGLLEAPTSA